MHILIDFDGTIALEDTTDQLLAAFALPEWQAIEARWEAGEIGSRTCLALQAQCLRVEPEALAQRIDQFDIDPDFARFAQTARRLGASIEVVSDGFDVSVRRVLSRLRLDIAFRCNALAYLGEGRWQAFFPHALRGCSADNGVCKCAARASVGPNVLIGDGRSDFCLARHADVVLAKGRLARHCHDEGIAHQPITSFDDALRWLTDVAPRLIGERVPVRARLAPKF